MAKYFYASSLFPFSTIFPLGMALVIIGVVSIGFGIVDVIYSNLKYVGGNCVNDLYVGWECPTKPCDSPSMDLAMAATGIWVGAILAVSGGLATSLVYASTSSIRIKRDVTAAFCGVTSLPIGPIGFFLCVFRLFYMNGSFFCTNNDVLTVTDHMEFLMTIFTLILMLVGWALAIVILVLLFRRGILTQGRDQKPGFAPRHPSIYDVGNPRGEGTDSVLYPSLDQSSGWQDQGLTTYNSQLSGKVYPYLTPGPVDGNYLNYSYPARVPPRNYYTTGALYSRY